MTPAEARAWLDSITGRGWKLTLERVTEVLRRLGDPQRRFRAVHVTGTNGKGSTCAFVEGILHAAGLRTGRTTSPHVVSLEERIRIDAADPSPEAFARWLSEVRRVAGDDQTVTYFEAVTSAAFYAFASAGVTHAAVEVGLGGRLDATRLCEPAVSLVTTVDLDHTRILGSTPEAIAGEKAGILREGVPLVTAATGGPLDVLRTRAAQVGAPVHVLGDHFSVKPLGEDRFLYEGPRWQMEVTPSLAGRHQGGNVACALAAAEILADGGANISSEDAARGITGAHLRGRLEGMYTPRHDVQVIVDCAHNRQGARALAAHIGRRYAGTPLHLVFGCLADKAGGDILEILAPLARRTTVVTVEAGTRTRTAEQLLSVARERGVDAVEACADPTAAVRAAVDSAAPGDLVLVAGSIYLAGDVLAASDAAAIWPTENPRARVTP